MSATIYETYARKDPQKDDSICTILDIKVALSRKYLSPHFYDNISSLLAENYPTEIKPPYFLPCIS